MNQRISRTQIIAIYDIEVSFFDELATAGLLHVEQEQDDMFLAVEHLHRLEKFANLYYDLEINIPGIEVIDRLLAQLKDLQHENYRLRLKQTPESAIDDINGEDL